MPIRRTFWVVLLMGAFRVGAAAAQLPADQTIQWRFRQAPSNAESPVNFRVIATLQALEQDGSAIGWEVQSLEFFQELADQTKSWVQWYPNLDTPDGLWWAVHDNPSIPALNEFLSSPELTGVAFADNSSEDDLVFSVQSAPAQAGEYANSAEVTYALAPTDPEQPPVKSGDDEPVEVHPTRDAD